ncbi:muscle, skeletal receptor tyrosine protein kinase-like [Asterias rubens]|uniref:muscle, skeletal receptor tyrosine protein kinase-like n=1 Tax=Asterias rubens TaxID=7604 RepID=UPI0014552EFB|nr:muscle, skeletal receptor tyrosine protein kinase-like [Asterias rubens]
MATPGLSKAVLQGSGPSACADHRWAWRYRRDCCLFVLLYLISLATSAPTYVPTSATTSEGLETSSTIQDATRQYTSTIASLKEVTELPREPSKVQVLPPEPQWTTQQQYTDPPVIQRPPENSSVVVEGRVTLRCQPTGAEPLRVRWEKDGVTLPLSGSRYNVKNNFNLKVFNASVSDRGMYRCWAENPGGSVYSSPAYLDVQVPAMIREEPQDYNVTYGTRVNLTCSVTGHPKPKLYWLRNRMRIFDRSARNPSFWEKEYYVFNATSSANYSCVVENVVTKSDDEKIQEIKKSRSAVIRVNNIPNYCATYNGNQCGNYLKGRQVFIDADLYNPINKQEPLLHDILSQIDSIVREGSCRNAFRSLMCHNMLPDCDVTKPAHPLPKPICREDCAVVRSELCHQDWVDLNQSRNQFFLKRFSQALGQSQCRDLPSKERSPGSCSEANLIVMPKDQITTDCYENQGQFYQGNTSVTKTGLECLPWTHSYPQSRNMYLSVFPELANSSNSCRNPGGMRQEPGCFPEGPYPQWQPCGVPNCADVTSTTLLPEKPTTSLPKSETSVTTGRRYIHLTYPTDYNHIGDPILKEPSNSKEIFIICGVSLAVVCFGIIVVVCAVYRRQYNRYSRYKYPGDFDISKLPENPMYGKDFNRSFNPHLRHLEYPRNSIIYIVDIGEGAFGRVFKAIAPRLLRDEASTTVAVKMLKTNADRDVQEYFNREAEIISRFDHANVIKLFGVCFVGKPLCLLLEYMGKGDLQEFLHYHSDKSGAAGLPGRTQLNLAFQVACGMVYLTEKRFVHRDIATRNCLVGNNNEVKISDFGLARYLGSSDQFLGHKDETIPIRWTAPEALWHYKFTTHSDVWSFGVLLWEIYSFAKQPYESMTHEEVFLKTYQGQRLECPENTPRCVYELIQMCCSLDLNARPSFYMVRDTLEAMQDGELVC